MSQVDIEKTVERYKKSMPVKVGWRGSWGCAS